MSRSKQRKDNVTAFIDVSIILRVMGDDLEVSSGDDPKNVFKFVHEVMPASKGVGRKDIGPMPSTNPWALINTVSHTKSVIMLSVPSSWSVSVLQRGCGKFDGRRSSQTDSAHNHLAIITSRPPKLFESLYLGDCRKAVNRIELCVYPSHQVCAVHAIAQ